MGATVTLVGPYAEDHASGLDGDRPHEKPRAPATTALFSTSMSPEDIKTLRRELDCTARALSSALGLEPEAVEAWERAELFPTKRACDAMEELRRKGPAAIPGKRRAPSTQALDDPEVRRLFRKLLAHPALRAAALDLAAGYDDPADERPPT